MRVTCPIFSPRIMRLDKADLDNQTREPLASGRCAIGKSAILIFKFSIIQRTLRISSRVIDGSLSG